MGDLSKHFLENAVSLASVVKGKEAVPIEYWVQIQSTHIIFYFLIFSATTSPGTQRPKLTIIVNSRQITN